VFNRNHKSVHWGTVTLIIHEPITAESRQGRASKAVMQEVYDIINKDLDPKYRDSPSA